MAGEQVGSGLSDGILPMLTNACCDFYFVGVMDLFAPGYFIHLGASQKPVLSGACVPCRMMSDPERLACLTQLRQAAEFAHASS